jgi:sulfite oxidase
LYEQKFKPYGYGEPIPEGDLYVHGRVMGDSTKRNQESREANRVLAKNPKDLPTLSYKRFKKMSDEPGKAITSFRGGVYDVTDFVKGHPGKDRILMANGLDLEIFWNTYKIHFRPHIQHLLEDYRIGTLTPKAAARVKSETFFENPYTDEPPRPRAILRMASERPANYGPRLHELTNSFYTPNELHYTRNHAPVPRVDPDEYTFTVRPNPAIGLKGREYSYKELKTKFKQHAVSVTLQCAGGRQEDFVTPDRPLYVEAKWREEAWGCARWEGPKVRDILKDCGLDMDAMALGQKPVCAKFLNAWAMDESETGGIYGSFCPFHKIVDPYGDAIVALKMNGEDVPRDHGYPARMLFPGYAGFRNVKWVNEISVTVDQIDEGCDQHNCHFGPDISFRGHYVPGCVGKGPTPDLEKVSAPRVCTVPVYSTITYPGMGQTFPGDADTVEIRGIAWAGAGRGINRVEVSIDGGLNFKSAELLEKPPEVRQAEPEPSHGLGRCWTWQQWKIDYPLTAEMKNRIGFGEKLELDICARARDGDFNVQPESVEDSYNVLGKCVNHWPRRVVWVDPRYKTGDELPPMLPMPPSGQWIWRRHYPERYDLDDAEDYTEEFERESVKVGTPIPPKSEWY